MKSAPPSQLAPTFDRIEDRRHDDVPASDLDAESLSKRIAHVYRRDTSCRPTVAELDAIDPRVTELLGRALLQAWREGRRSSARVGWLDWAIGIALAACAGGMVALAARAWTWTN